MVLEVIRFSFFLVDDFLTVRAFYLEDNVRCFGAAGWATSRRFCLKQHLCCVWRRTKWTQYLEHFLLFFSHNGFMGWDDSSLCNLFLGISNTLSPQEQMNVGTSTLKLTFRKKSFGILMCFFSLIPTSIYYPHALVL